MRAKNSCMAAMAALLICASAAFAQGGAGASVEAKVDAVFAAYDKPGSPGCALGVIRDGKLTYARGYGYANLEYNIPITAQTIFDIGSTSKQFTASSIVLLAQQGKLSLEDDVRKFVPELPDYGKKITIRHLLNHTSGIRDYLTLFSLAGTDFDGVTNDDDALRIIVRQKALNFDPGQEYLYSNSGFFLLSVIVKRASGKTLREFAQEQIFGPLQMKATHFHDNHTEIVPLRATGYAPKEGRGFQIDMSLFEQTGDGAVYTSVEDLLAWDQNFYDPRMGGQSLIRELLVRGVLNNGEKLEYALGLMNRNYKGLNAVSHGGSWAGYRAELLRFPEEKFSVVCLCNLATTNPSQLAQQVADIYLADKLKAPETRVAAKPETIQLPEEALKKFAGLYRNPTTGALRRISLKDGKLRADQFSAQSFELAAVAANRFRVMGVSVEAELTFEGVAGKERPRITLNRENSKPEIFEPIEAAPPTPQQLAEYAGSYFSEELDTKYTLAVEENQLAIRGKSGSLRKSQATFRDAFITGEGVQFEFQRDGNGRIAGFAVQAGRVRNIRFDRQK